MASLPTSGRRVLHRDNARRDTLSPSKKKRTAQARRNRFGKEGSADRVKPGDWAFCLCALRLRDRGVALASVVAGPAPQGDPGNEASDVPSTAPSGPKRRSANTMRSVAISTTLLQRVP